MKLRSAHYRILIEKELQPDGSEVFISFVPQLGISDFGDNVEETVANTQQAIEIYIESLVAHGQSIPTSSNSFYLIAESSVTYPQST